MTVAFKQFQFSRRGDRKNQSGSGLVAEGVQFSNGTVVVRWLTNPGSICIFESLAVFCKLHDHYREGVVWL